MMLKLGETDAMIREPSASSTSPDARASNHWPQGRVRTSTMIAMIMPKGVVFIAYACDTDPMWTNSSRWRCSRQNQFGSGRAQGSLYRTRILARPTCPRRGRCGEPYSCFNAITRNWKSKGKCIRFRSMSVRASVRFLRTSWKEARPVDHAVARRHHLLQSLKVLGDGLPVGPALIGGAAGARNDGVRDRAGPR